MKCTITVVKPYVNLVKGVVMIRWIHSKIGAKLLIIFSGVLVLSMFSLIYIATQMLREFGEFSVSKNEINIRDNAKAFMARITHEQAMRYDSIFKKLAASSALIAKQATFFLENTALYGKNPLKPNEKLVIYPRNKIFSNDRSERTMVLYWGSLAMSPGIREQIKTLSHLDTLLETVKEENPESVASYVVTEPGISRYYPNIHGVEKLPSTTKFDIRNAAWYVIAKPENNLERKTVWSNIYLDSVGQGLLITASSPIYSKKKEYLGAAGVDVTLDTIVKDIFENIPSPHRIKDLFSFLVDNQGRLIAFPPEYLDMFEIKIDRDKLVDASIILKHSLLDSSNSEIRNIGKSMLEKNFGVSEFILNGQSYLISSHFMPSTGWRLGVVVPESAIFASIQEVRNTLDLTFDKMIGNFTLVTVLFLIFSIIVIVVFSIKTFIRPLDKLSKGALRVQEGDLTTHVDIDTKNEIGLLAKVFNNMVDTLRQARDREKTYAENLEQEVKDRTREIRIKNENLKSALQKLKQEGSERQEAEEALREGEERMKAILSASPVGIGLVTHRKLGWANETMYRMLGYEQGSLLGQSARVLYLEDDEYERAGREIYAGITEGKIAKVETRWVRKDGTVFDCMLQGCSLDPAEPSRGQILTVSDISQAKRLESQLHQGQKMEAIGILAGGIAHDFNNILSSIIGFTELALDDVGKGTPIEDNLQEVYTAGKRARDLVKQILAFSRQSDEERKPIRVDTIAKEVLRLIRSTIPTTIEIKENVESRSLIMGNPSQVYQLFMNLCTNAAQAMEKAGSILEVGLTDVEFNDQSAHLLSELKSGNYMKVTVSDNGPGISPDIIGSIFEPYFTTKGIGEGTGMGLALVHGIVESYGGKISVESELGKGTVFSIYLPITKKREDHLLYEKEKLPSGTESILFVDDELPIAKMGNQILEGLGYRVNVRTSSVEALELFRSKPDDFDLVITDMTMPNMTGDELAIELMKIRSDIPVILCTGYSKKISDKNSAAIGIKAFAYKPIVKADLAKTVRKVLDEAKSDSASPTIRLNPL